MLLISNGISTAICTDRLSLNYGGGRVEERGRRREGGRERAEEGRWKREGGGGKVEERGRRREGGRERAEEGRWKREGGGGKPSRRERRNKE